MEGSTSRYKRGYILVCCAVFGAFAGGIFFTDTHAGYNVIEGSGNILEVYVFKSDNGTLRAWDHGIGLVLTTNTTLNFVPGVCYHLVLNGDVVTQRVNLSSQVVDRMFCSRSGGYLGSVKP